MWRRFWCVFINLFFCLLCCLMMFWILFLSVERMIVLYCIWGVFRGILEGFELLNWVIDKWLFWRWWLFVVCEDVDELILLEFGCKFMILFIVLISVLLGCLIIFLIYFLLSGVLYGRIEGVRNEFLYSLDDIFLVFEWLMGFLVFIRWW